MWRMFAYENRCVQGFSKLLSRPNIKKSFKSFSNVTFQVKPYNNISLNPQTVQKKLHWLNLEKLLRTAASKRFLHAHAFKRDIFINFNIDREKHKSTVKEHEIISEITREKTKLHKAAHNTIIYWNDSIYNVLHIKL